MKFVIATNNAHKLEELGRMLQSQGHTVLSMAQAGAVADPEETGATFVENALIKAQAVQAETGLPTLADDSGLMVDALDGAPGVYSARYAGVHGDSEGNNEKLLRELEAVPAEKRGAQFVSALALVMPDGRQLTVEGHCRGSIGFERKGKNGFGYDPLFYVDGRSFAEMSGAEKDAISHRAVALRKLQLELPGFLAEG